VVEPFTGEGISYALNSAELAAGAIVSLRQGVNENEVAQTYAAAQARLYRGRLWVNRLARAAVLSPRLASAFLQIASFQPAILRFLTGKIVRL
jgi:flavin-dependent dehydrogenase